MPKVATFCPRCGESIETDVPDAAKAAGRAEIKCPACALEFQIAPAKRDTSETSQHQQGNKVRLGFSNVPGPKDRKGQDGPDGKGDGGATGGQAPPSGGVPPAPVPDPAPTAVPGVTPAPAGTSQGPAAWGPTGLTGTGTTGTGVAGRSMKPVLAAFLLVLAAVLYGWMGYEMATQPELVQQGLAEVGGQGRLDGRVLGPEGDPVANASVAIIDGPGENTSRTAATGPDGRYRFDNLTAGAYTIHYSASGLGNHTRELPVYPEEWSSLMATAGVGVVTLPADGETETDFLGQANSIARGIGYGFMVAGAIVAVGAYAAFARRWFPLTIVAAVLAMLAIFVFPVALAGLGALVLLILSRKEFGRRSGDSA